MVNTPDISLAQSAHWKTRWSVSLVSCVGRLAAVRERQVGWLVHEAGVTIK